MRKQSAYSDKSFVTMEQQVCIVCGKPFDTGALLLDKRLRDTFDRYTVTGMGLCPDDQKKMDEGYLALVEIDPAKSSTLPNGNMDPKDVYRTGVVVHIRRKVAKQVFNVPIPDDLPMLFIDPEVTAKLQSMMPEEEVSHEKD